MPGLRRSPGEGKGYPLQYSGLENSMDCIAHGVSKNWTRLSDFHSPRVYKCYLYSTHSPAFMYRFFWYSYCVFFLVYPWIFQIFCCHGKWDFFTIFNKLLFVYRETMDLSSFFVVDVLTIFQFFFLKSTESSSSYLLFCIIIHIYIFSWLIAQAKTLRTILGKRQ